MCVLSGVVHELITCRLCREVLPRSKEQQCSSWISTAAHQTAPATALSHCARTSVRQTASTIVESHLDISSLSGNRAGHSTGAGSVLRPAASGAAQCTCTSAFCSKIRVSRAHHTSPCSTPLAGRQLHSTTEGSRRAETRCSANLR
jgi:hypothetical protein